MFEEIQLIEDIEIKEFKCKAIKIAV